MGEHYGKGGSAKSHVRHGTALRGRHRPERGSATLVEEGFTPIISEVRGFVAYYWVDAGDGVMVSTSVFEDRSGAEESNSRASDFVQENLASLLPNPPQIAAGEVVAHKAS